MSFVYVAGASSEIERCERVIGALREAGHTITEDWCAKIRASQCADRDLSKGARVEASTADLHGVASAQLVLLLVPDSPSAGCWVELGYALSKDLAIAVAGDWTKSIFTELADYKFDSDADAIAWLVKS